MTARSPTLVGWLVVAPFFASAVAAALLPSGDLAWLSALALLPWIVLALDAVDASIRMLAVWRRRRAHVSDETARDATPWRRGAGADACAFVAVVRDLGHDVDAWITRRAPLRDATWLADVGSSDATRMRLAAAGWRCADLAHVHGERAALAQLVSGLPSGIATVVLLEANADFVTAIDAPERFGRALREFQRGHAAAVCPRTIHARDGFAALLSHHEAQREFGLEGRSLGFLATLSGNAIYRRDVLQRLLGGSRRSHACDDTLADTLAILGGGERIVCDDRLEVRVAAPAGFGAWLLSAAARWLASSRELWTSRRECASVARRGPLAFYHYVLYAGVFRLLAAPARIGAALVLLASFLAVCFELAGVATGGAAIANPRALAPVFGGYLLLHVVTASLAERAGQRFAAAALAPLAPMIFIAGSLVPLAAVFVRSGPDRRAEPDGYPSEVSRVAQ